MPLVPRLLTILVASATTTARTNGVMSWPATTSMGLWYTRFREVFWCSRSHRTPAGVVAADEEHVRLQVGRRRESGVARPLRTRRRLGQAVLHQRRPRDDRLALHDLALGVADPVAVPDQPAPHRGGNATGGLEQVDRQPGRQELRQPVPLLEIPSGQTHDGGTVEHVITPTASGVLRRMEHAVGVGEVMRRTVGHPRIFAQRPPVAVPGCLADIINAMARQNGGDVPDLAAIGAPVC